MARQVVPLTDTKIKNAKPKDKNYKLHDGKGLFIIISKSGGKWWRFKYKFPKDKVISLGTYPEVGLKEARDKRDEYRKLVANGIDPKSFLENLKKANFATKNTFEFIANEWLIHISKYQSQDYNKRVKLQFEKNIFSHVNNKLIDTITKDDWIKIFSIMANRGVNETLHRMLNYVSRVYNYAISKDICTINPILSIDKKNTFPPRPKKNYPFIRDSKKLGQLLRDIDNYEGYDITKFALKLLPHLFVRPYNLRYMEWEEINFETKIWSIPASKMKMKRAHLVPLSSQVIKILQSIPKISNFVFPSPRSKTRPLSDGTLNVALKSLGYTGDILVPHSFRHTASTLLHENMHIHGFSSDVIEKQLAHDENNKVKAVYNHAKHLNERIELMQWWSNFLENIKR